MNYDYKRDACMMATQPPKTLPFNGEKIPASLKATARWAPWKATFNAERMKYDKIPHQAGAPYSRISTAHPELWYTYEQAAQAATGRRDLFAGVGYVLTEPHGIVGIDLDGCVEGNVIADWAQKVIDAMASYTELSPSGKGIRILVAGQIDADWTNIDVGIEVYGGNRARFLTVTGQRLRKSVTEVTQPSPEALAGLRDAYGKVRTVEADITRELPDLIDTLALPDLGGLGLNYKSSDFLTEGESGRDRSRTLFASAVELYSAGLTNQQVFSVLAHNPYAMEVALDHRGQDADRALQYLWVEHCQKAKPKAAATDFKLDDFEDVSEASGNDVSEGEEKGEKGNVTGTIPPAAKPMRFAFTSGEDFFDPSIPDTKWTIKRVLPETGLGMVFGPSMSGKTFFVLDMAMSVALGKEWRGHKVNAGQVAYICAEGGTGFRKRGLAYLTYHGLERKGLPFHLLADAPNLLERGDVKDLIASLRMIDNLKLVVVDTLAATTAGANENASEDMGRAMAHCTKIVAATGALVLLVGHTGKDEGRGHRGWSGMPAAFDVSIQLERSGEYRAATIVKMKDGEGEGKEYPFHLNGVELGKDEDLEPITSCVALPGNKEGVETPKDGLTDNQRMVLQVVRDLVDLGGLVTPKDVREVAREKLPKPIKGKSDNRTRDIKNSYDNLVTMQRIADDTGYVRFIAG